MEFQYEYPLLPLPSGPPPYHYVTDEELEALERETSSILDRMAEKMELIAIMLQESCEGCGIDMERPLDHPLRPSPPRITRTPKGVKFQIKKPHQHRRGPKRLKGPQEGTNIAPYIKNFRKPYVRMELTKDPSLNNRNENERSTDP